MAFIDFITDTERHSSCAHIILLLHHLLGVTLCQGMLSSSWYFYSFKLCYTQQRTQKTVITVKISNVIPVRFYT